MDSVTEARREPQVADTTGGEKLVTELERLTRRVEAAATLIERLRHRLTELEEENRTLLRERQEVSTRLTALIEKVDLLPDDS
jgi:predicted nuclease with TOPRIM domain